MVIQNRLGLASNDWFAAVSYLDSLIFKTGAQRSERPLFIHKIAPCRHACPIGIDIPKAFDLASKGELDRALSIYLQENPLPGVCGRVCYHPCETKCNRGSFDEPINIRSFERFLSDHAHGDLANCLPIHSKKEKVAVIGSGPAGLSAAYHLARLGYHVDVYEARSELGGILRYGIPPYRLPRSILDREIERILSLGIQIHLKKTLGKNLGWEELDSFDAVFLSVGLQSGKMLFKEEGTKDFILTGLDFLADPKKRSLEKSIQKTIIIGGGNVAFDVARTLLRLRNGKVNNIILLCPEARDQMPALLEEIDEALEEGIKIFPGWAPHKLYKKNRKCMALDFYQSKVIKDEASGLLEILPAGGKIKKQKVDKIIIAIGQALKSFVLPEGLEIKENGIVTDQFGRTSLPKVFAGGDATGGKAFVADAIASSKMGALSIACFFEGREIDKEFQEHQIGDSSSFSLQQFIEHPQENRVDLKKVVPFEQINTLFFSKGPRIHPKKLSPSTRKKTFEEVIKGLEFPLMEEEISRCFKCGTCIDCEYCIDFCPDISILKDSELGLYQFDYDHCKGCGICFVACPRNVIEMARETG